MVIAIKTLLVMKLTSVLLLAACLQVSAKGNGQNISISQRNTTLEKVFKEIHIKTGYQFFYHDELLQQAKKFDISVKNASIEQVLDLCFKDQPLNFTITEKAITIKRKEEVEVDVSNAPPSPPVLIKVTGKITDDKGQPLEGATILVQGTNNGVKSDADGDFSIDAAPNSTLVISYIGFETTEVKIGNQANISVQMKPSIAIGEQIVVVGYGTQKKKDITGSVAVVDMRAMKSIPAGSAVQGLQGQASGVNVISSGVPGGPSNIFIRGVSSFGNTQPLVLVDGVQTDLNNIISDDIESMQVLKDAGAAAIYGVRGSNGVIVVTTKKGKKGQPIITYDSYYGLQLPIPGNPFNLLNSEDYARLAKIANPGTVLFANGLPDYIYRGPGVAGTGMEGDPEVDPSKYNFDPANPANNYLIQKVDKKGVNWFQEAFNPAPMMNHNITASGGTEKSSYLFSLGYFDQEGTLMKTFLKRYSARINTEYKVNNNIRIGENAYVFYKQNPSFNNLNEGNPISSTYRIMPIIPVYDIAGNYGGTFAGPELGEGPNAVAVQERTVNNRANTWNVIGNVFAEVDFLKHFTARTSIGGTIDHRYNINFGFNGYNNTVGNTAATTLNENSQYNSSIIWTNTIRYSNEFGKHNLSVLAGSEALKNYGRSLGGGVSGLFSTDFSFLRLNNGTSNVTNFSSAYVNALFSLFTRVDYAFDDKYLIGLTVRRDGSSKFGSEKKYGIFPSVSLGWRVTNEKFMQNVSWLNDLKIRGSYGILGSEQNLNASNAFTLFGGSFGDAYYDIAGTGNSIQQGFYQTRNGNPNTGWEENVVSNFGFDATVLNNMLDFSFEYYKKSINGLLFPQPLSASAGNATPPVINIGDIQNSGFDISATYRGNINKVQFSVGANITSYKNKVIDIPGSGFFDVSGSRIGNLVRNQEGYPVSSFFGYEVIGLFRDSADIANSSIQNAAAPGRFKYRDINNDKSITPADRTFFGSPNPDFTYGINLRVNYKNFDFSTIFYGSQGNKILNHVRWWTDFFGSFAGAKSNDLLNAWTPTNTNTKTPKVEQSNNFSTSGVANSYYMENGSYLKLRSLIIGYTIKPSTLRKLRINRFRIYAQAANLFTITKYTGLDPEISASGINSSNNQSASFGIDYGNYPNNQKNFLLGVNLSF